MCLFFLQGYKYSAWLFPRFEISDKRFAEKAILNQSDQLWALKGKKLEGFALNNQEEIIDLEE